MTVAAFQSLIACGRTHACLFIKACGGNKIIVCGGMWLCLMPDRFLQYASATDAFSDAGQVV